MSSAKDSAPVPTPAGPLVQDPQLRQAMRAHITGVVLARVTQDEARRAEALRDYLAVTQAAPDVAAADTLSLMIPPLMPSLYRRWSGMFADRLFETASEEQLRVLCDGSEENGAALALTFVMFLESERMEKQMSEDLCALGNASTGAGGAAAGESGEQGPMSEQMADVAAGYIRSRVAQLAKQQAAAGSKKKDN